MKKMMLSAAGLAVALAAPAFADDGWYVKGGIGYGAFDDTDIVDQSDSSNTLEIQGEGDLRFMAGVGYAFANGFRFDFDIMDRYNDMGAPGNLTPGASDLQNIALMANALYDFNPGGRISPYAGLGVGISAMDYSVQQGLGADFISLDEEETDIAGQAILGLGFALSERLTADVEYRYFVAPDLGFEVGGDSFELERPTSHDVLFGLRYALSAPAPAVAPVAPTPAPAAAPAPAPTAQATPAPVAAACDDVDFVVYFDWDRSDLTSQAQQVVANAADRAKRCEITRVAIEGHADRSGNASYNVGLSERRARVVREELIRLGVPGSLIAVEARGESAPAVATPDGAREPLNRRTEVVIRVE